MTEREKNAIIFEAVDETILFIYNLINTLQIDNFEDFKRVLSVKADAIEVDRLNNACIEE